MTVSELRELLAGQPDDVTVYILISDGKSIEALDISEAFDDAPSNDISVTIFGERDSYS